MRVRSAHRAALLVAALVAIEGPGVRAGTPPEAKAPPAPAAPVAPDSGTPWLGVVLGDALDGGVRIVALVPGGPASRAGLREGDLVIRVNGTDVPDRRAFWTALEPVRPGEALRLGVLRGGTLVETSVEARTRPADLAVLAPLPPDLPWVLGGSTDLGAVATAIPRELRTHYGAPADAGLLVTRVEAGSRAEAAGLRVGDVLVRAAGTDLESEADLDLAVRSADRGALTLVVVRQGKRLEARVAARGSGRSLDPESEAAEARVRTLERLVERARKQLESLEAELEEARRKR